MVQFKRPSFPEPVIVSDNSFTFRIFGIFFFFMPKKYQISQRGSSQLFFFHKQTVLMRQNKLFTNTQQTLFSLPGGEGAACDIKHRSITQQRQTKARNDECRAETEV